MLRLRSLFPVAVLVASALGSAWGCASSEEPTPEGNFDSGPTTTRPDDGVDSTKVDGGGDTITTDTSTGNDTGSAPADSAADTASGADTRDAPATDTRTDAVTTTDTANEAATDTASAADTATDAAAPGGPKVHEVFCNDFATTGARAAYIEISAPPGTPLAALHIRTIKSTGAVAGDWPITTVAGTVMPASGLWVVGGQLVGVTIDQEYDIFGADSWDVPCTGAVQLNDHSAVAVRNLDVVGYGSVANPTTAPTAISEGGVLAPTSTSGKSIGRKSVPGDTNNNANDFCNMNKSPRQANDACL